MSINRTMRLAALLGLLISAPAVGQDIEAGRVVYESWCVECHGAEGLGDGSAAASMMPRPRDFSQARYQVRTTGSGQLPTDADLLNVLDNGLPGTTMPGWPNLSANEKQDVIAYVKSFSRFFAAGPAPEALDFGSDPGGGVESSDSGELCQNTSSARQWRLGYILDRSLQSCRLTHRTFNYTQAELP